MDELKELKSYVRQLPRGPVLEVVVVENLLMNCWDLLDLVYDDTSMVAYKLSGRTEDLSWNPPHLTFNLERHGGVAKGSKIAEVHSWRVNVEEGTAGIVGRTTRPLQPLEKPLNANELAKELTSLVAGSGLVNSTTE